MNIAIAGAGIAGLAAAIALKKTGANITVYEAAAEIKPVGAGLGLAPNAIAALDVLGLKESVLQLGHQLDSFHITNRHGKLLSKAGSNDVRQQYGTDNFTIHRAALQKVLIDAAAGITIKTGKSVKAFTQADGKIQLLFNDNTLHECDYLIAADGINSAIRKQLLPSANKHYAGYTCWRGVATLPDIKTNIAVEVWDKRGRLGIVPLKDGQIYWFACVNAQSNDARYKAFGIQELSKHFRHMHPMAEAIITATPETGLIHNDIYDLPPLRNYVFGNILLTGDAAHAATPNMAQGACQALEDAAVLSSLLESGERQETVFKQFEKMRIPKTQYIIQQSRKIGVIAQSSNPIVIALRDMLLPLMPASMQRKQMDILYKTDF